MSCYVYLFFHFLVLTLFYICRCFFIQKTTAAPTKEAETTAAPTKEAETTAAPTKEAETTAAPTKEVETTAAPTKEAETTTAPTKEAETTAAPTKEAEEGDKASGWKRNVVMSEKTSAQMLLRSDGITR
jgi:hypothetical protein